MPDISLFQPLIDAALAEDFGSAGFPRGDATSQALIPAELEGVMRFHARVPLVMAGGAVAARVFATLDAGLRCDIRVEDGARAEPGTALVEARGAARSLLGAERVALNLLQRACGVATLTRAYADAVAGTRAKILDTRKTMPGLRALDKYAVTCGGGVNHRFGLYDAILIKDNHLALCGGVLPALALARAEHALPVILECDTLAQVEEALAAPVPPDRILLDNMSLAALSRAVELTAGRVKLEASGGVTLATVRDVAQTGVDFISVGALTHSAQAVDIGAEIAF